jgi:hypothetical protein
LNATQSANVYTIDMPSIRVQPEHSETTGRLRSHRQRDIRVPVLTYAF